MKNWYAFKKHFKKNNNKIICIKSSWLKISNIKHSNELSSNDKIKVKKDDSFIFIKEELLYYIIEYPTEKKKNIQKPLDMKINNIATNSIQSSSIIIKKKKIAILFSGQIRINPLGSNKQINQQILSSINKYLLNTKITTNYDVNIFISTDNINIEKCLKFFNTNIKNIHCSDNNYYLHSYNHNNVSWSKCHNTYMNRNYGNYQIYPNNLMQFYRIYDCFKLMEEYEKTNGLYDYIIRSRLDVVYCKDIFNNLEELDNNLNTIYFGACDLFSLGRRSIMEYFCTAVIDKIGSYTVKCPDEIRWRYAPEVQVHACLQDYCDKNKKNFSISIKNVGIPSLNDFIIICR